MAITAAGFERDARYSAETFGLPSLALAVVPQPFTSRSTDEIVAMADAATDRVVSALTSRDGDEGASGIVTVPDQWLVFEGADLLGALEAMNARYLEYGWSDGFPLVPPTADRLDRMLGGTSRPRDDVVGILDPGLGIATVEGIAANAVMAGCRPEYLPVVIAAIECFTDARFGFKSKAMSTGPQTPLLMVNGPIRKRIGLNAGRCALGPGSISVANTTIGRAVRLCMMNLGLCYPDISDLDTIGSPLKYSLCVAENEEDSPWQPYHVDRGHSPEASTITAQFVYGTCELNDKTLNPTPESLVGVFSTAAKTLQVSTGKWLTGLRKGVAEDKEHHLLLLSPEQADIFAKHGWSKHEIGKAMFEAARLPFRTLMSTGRQRVSVTNAHPELEWLWDKPDTLMPVLEDPDCYDIAVVGGPVSRGAFFWGCGGPITKAING